MCNKNGISVEGVLGLVRRSLKQHELEVAFRDNRLDKVRHLLVHSSLSSLGHVEGGARTVLDALMAVLGPAGTLMAPTFNYFLEDHEVFDPLTKPSQTGAIPEALRKCSGAVRSFHPTYSVAALGPDAVALTSDHWQAEPVGMDCPIDRLAREGGSVLLIGVKHDANSTIHVGEAYADVPYRGIPFEPSWPRTARTYLPTGECIELDLHNEPGCSTAFGVIELPLREQGSISDFKIGQCKCQLMKAMDIIEATVQLLEKDMSILLCSNPNCRFCPRARESIRQWEKGP